MDNHQRFILLLADRNVLSPGAMIILDLLLSVSVWITLSQLTFTSRLSSSISAIPEFRKVMVSRLLLPVSPCKRLSGGSYVHAVQDADRAAAEAFEALILPSSQADAEAEEKNG